MEHIPNMLWPRVCKCSKGFRWRGLEPEALTWSHTLEGLDTFSVLRLFKALVYKAAALTTTLWYKMANGNLLQKKKSFTYWRLDTYFLITLKNYYYQKFRNIYFFSSSHCILCILYAIFHVSLSRSLSSLHFAWVATWEKTQNHLIEEKNSCNATKTGWCRTWSFFSICVKVCFQVTCFPFIFISMKFPSISSLYNQIKSKIIGKSMN